MKPIFIIALILFQSLSVTNASEVFTKMTYLGTNQKTILNPEAATEHQFEDRKSVV